MPHRRRSTINKLRETGNDIATREIKLLELETRISRLERAFSELHQSIDTLGKRTIAIQAHLDHVNARLGHH